MNAADCPSIVTGSAHDIKAAGCDFWGVYLRSDRCTQEMLDGLHSVGIKVFSIWERGNPTDPAYFSAAQGTEDAGYAIGFASTHNQPTGTPIFFCVDYDASGSELAGPIEAYMEAVHEACSQAGYLVGVYGSGLTCSTFVAAGYAHYGYLAGSQGFAGYQDFLRSSVLAIQQVDENATVAGFAVDTDQVVLAEVCW
jgi:hypothetical protein